MDEAAEHEFREYVAARQGALFRAALLLTGHREDAEDLLQAALTKLASRWVTVRSFGSPDGYVRKILYNQRISWWRKKTHRQEYLTGRLPGPSTIDDLSGTSAVRIAVAKALSQLTVKQRAVIILRYFEDLPESEVAVILGCSVGILNDR